MIITIASGKGGTGKTTLATNLARAAGKPVALLDCDVEEPNAHLFLRPAISAHRPVHKLIPQIDTDRCTYCGQCSQSCAYHALAVLPKEVLVFSELCHGCGGCMRVCPEGAITETEHEVGVVEHGQAGEITCISGRLHIGEAMAGPVIRAVKRQATAYDTVIIDAPPGTSCSVVSTLLHSDYAILVTEPTPFGLHDLTLAVDVARELKIPHGVVINRADCANHTNREYSSVDTYCQENQIPILMRIPNDRAIAEAYSRGHMLVDALPQYREQFQHLLTRLEAEVNNMDGI